jgi:hypothetical protein
MTEEEGFEEFTQEIIPQQLFHVSPKDIDVETGGRLDEVILLGLLAAHPNYLKFRPLKWFIDTYIENCEE